MFFDFWRSGFCFESTRFCPLADRYLRTAAVHPRGLTSWLSLTNIKSWPTIAACCKSTTTRATLKVTSLQQHRTLKNLSFASETSQTHRYANVIMRFLTLPFFCYNYTQDDSLSLSLQPLADLVIFKSLIYRGFLSLQIVFFCLFIEIYLLMFTCG